MRRTWRCSRSACRAPPARGADHRRPPATHRAPAATPVPIQLTFNGGYVALNKLVRKLTGLVAMSGGKVHASGPLLSINSVNLAGTSRLTGQHHRHHLPVRRPGRRDDRRTRMSSLRRDLVERKLWMVVAILVVAVVAVPVFLLKGASASTTPTVPAPPAATATSAPTTTTATTPSAEPVKVVLARIARDPFASGVPKLSSKPASAK